MKPKCRLCGHEHWSNEPHKLPDVVERKDHHVAVREVLSETVDRQAAFIEKLQGRIKELEAKGQPTVSEARKAYMREYMKKRRAK